MRRIGVVTGARSDYSIYLPVLRAIAAAPGLDLLVVAGGSHLDPKYGRTIDAIRADGFEVAATVEMVPESDAALATAEAMGRGLAGFARAFSQLAPDLVLVLGDRFEMLSAATAALPLRVPLAHIHGGEITEGALDDAVRHAMTKLSHLHFVATEEYAARVIGLGEEPWRVIVSGAPALDNLRVLQLMPRDELERTFELEAGRPFLLATWHPVTLQPEQGAAQLEALLDALQASGLPVVITYPNADMGSAAIIERLRAFAAGRADVRLVRNLGTRAYFSAMAHAAAMIGNSSSGIIEAASFQLPVVNIGDRQRGRVRGINVIDCAPAVDAIGAALAEAISPSFRQALRGCRNPYGDGAAAARIVDTIASVPLDDRLLRKRFHEGGGHPTPGLGAAASAALSGRA